MTVIEQLSVRDLRRTVGPTPMLPCKAILVSVSKPPWPLLKDIRGRERLIERLCEALLADPADPPWTAPLEATDQPPSAFLARLLAATAIHLQNVTGHPVHRFAALWETGADGSTVALEYLWPRTGEVSARVAAELLTAAAGPNGEAQDTVPPERVHELVNRVTSAVGNSVVEVILTAAYRRGMPFHFIDPVFPMIAIGQGSSMKRLMTSMSHSQGHISTLLTRDKMLGLRILREAGFPVPAHYRAANADAAVRAAEQLGYPVVVKPLDLMRSKGVAVNLTSPEAVRDAFEAAYALSRNVMVEKHLPGLPYRILVIDGRACAAMRRSVPMVVGDGSSDITKLIELTNLERTRMTLRNSAAPRRIDVEQFKDELHDCLAAQGLSLQSVPAAGQEVQLAFMARTGRGGENLDVTDMVHSDNLAMAEQAARIFEVKVFGLDFMTDDISRSYKEGDCGINEVNNEPALSLHLAATQSPRDVVTPFLDMEFGSGENGCIPVICCLDDPEGTRFALLERALVLAGQRPGLAAGSDVARTGRFVLPRTKDVVRPAERILADPRVDCALIALTQDDFTRGLAFDSCSAVLLPQAATVAHDSQIIAQSRLIATELAATVIMPEEDHNFWIHHLDLSGRRVILLAKKETPVAARPDDSPETLSLRSGRGIDLRYHHDGHVDRLIALDQAVRADAEMGGQLLLAVAALLSLGWHPRDISGIAADALAESPGPMSSIPARR